MGLVRNVLEWRWNCAAHSVGTCLPGCEPALLSTAAARKRSWDSTTHERCAGSVAQLEPSPSCSKQKSEWRLLTVRGERRAAGLTITHALNKQVLEKHKINVVAPGCPSLGETIAHCVRAAEALYVQGEVPVSKEIAARQQRIFNEEIGKHPSTSGDLPIGIHSASGYTTIDFFEIPEGALARGASHAFHHRCLL